MGLGAVHQEEFGTRIRMTRALLRPFLIVAVTLLSFCNSRAEFVFKVVPGLLHSNAPAVLTDILVPATKIAQEELVIRPLTNRFSASATSSVVSGPVGVSRFLAATEDPDCEEFWGPDKWRHIGVWFVGTMGIYLFFKNVFKASKLASFLVSAVAMTVVGLAREFSDSNSEKNCFSEQDIFANSLGILAAGVVIAIF
jgi:hypothetical protein